MLNSSVLFSSQISHELSKSFCVPPCHLSPDSTNSRREWKTKKLNYIDENESDFSWESCVLWPIRLPSSWSSSSSSSYVMIELMSYNNIHTHNVYIIVCTYINAPYAIWRIQRRKTIRKNTERQSRSRNTNIT